LESNLNFGLILYWNEISFSGSFLDWKMLQLAAEAQSWRKLAGAVASVLDMA